MTSRFRRRASALDGSDGSSPCDRLWRRPRRWTVLLHRLHVRIGDAELGSLTAGVAAIIDRHAAAIPLNVVALRIAVGMTAG